MSDKIKKTVLNTLTEPIANSAKNITDKPTQNIGTTLADIWYLVFGGISQTAEKRKLKYSYALQEFENELKEKINNIPTEKIVEPDIQLVAKALEEAKYCMDKEELRNMFSSLISSSMNKDINVSPIIINIVSNLSHLDAKILNYYFDHQFSQISIEKLYKYLGFDFLTASYTTNSNISASLLELHHLDLIYSPDKISPKNIKKVPPNKKLNKKDSPNISYGYKCLDGTYGYFENTRLTSLGLKLCNICLK